MKRHLKSALIAVPICFFCYRVFSQNAVDPEMKTNAKEEKIGIVEEFKKTRFSEGLIFEDVRAEIAIGQIVSEVSRENGRKVKAFYLSKIDKNGASSFPSNRRINLSLKSGVDGFTALEYVLNQAIWHWEIAGENLLIVPWGDGEFWEICPSSKEK